MRWASGGTRADALRSVRLHVGTARRGVRRQSVTAARAAGADTRDGRGTLPSMKLIKRPLVVALRATYWAPVGLVLMPARDAVRVVRDSLDVIARQLVRRGR